MTILSLKGVVPYLLTKRLKYVLSKKFCQDDIENYFGRQKAIGRRKDNPNVKDTGYADNTIKSQFSVQSVEGNVLLGASKWNLINDSPLSKKKKKKKSEFLAISYYLLSVYFVCLLY